MIKTYLTSVTFKALIFIYTPHKNYGRMKKITIFPCFLTDRMWKMVVPEIQKKNFQAPGLYFSNPLNKNFGRPRFQRKQKKYDEKKFFKFLGLHGNFFNPHFFLCLIGIKLFESFLFAINQKDTKHHLINCTRIISPT